MKRYLSSLYSILGSLSLNNYLWFSTDYMTILMGLSKMGIFTSRDPIHLHTSSLVLYSVKIKSELRCVRLSEKS